MSIEFPVTVRNLKPDERVDSKSPGMNVPMTGDPKLDNISILDDKPPIFHNAPNYDIEQNPFSFLYFDTTYECNMECGFCYNPIRKYKDMDIDKFEDMCARLPRPVAMRFVGGEPTLYKHLFKAIEVGSKYNHQICIVTNGLRLSSYKFAKSLKEVCDKHPSVNVSLSLNGGLYNDEWYEKIDHDISHRKRKVKALKNLIDLKFKRVCINANIVRGLNEGVIKEFYDCAMNTESGIITNIRFRCAAKQGRYVEDLMDEDQTSYTGEALNNYIKTIIPEANKPLHWIRDGIHPSTGSGKHINNPNLKCNKCCFMYYITPKLWVATVEFGSHNSTLCWRRGQYVESTNTIQPTHHYMDELSRYINTYVPDGIRQLSKHMEQYETEDFT